MTASIFEIKRFAVHDGDGIRTTVFFKGCHNPEGLTSAPQIARYSHKCIGCGECKKEGFVPEDCIGDAQILYGKEITVEELLPALLEDRDFYETSGGGVTLSGGECLMQADFCAELLKRLKEHGIHTAVDTCGLVSKRSLDKVIPYTDVFLYDIKAFDEDVHKRLTGVSNAVILHNLRYLDSLGKAIEIRIPYVPECNADQMEKIAKLLSELKNIRKIRVLPYHSYASHKYAALGIKNTLPTVIPEDFEISRIEKTFNFGTEDNV